MDESGCRGYRRVRAEEKGIPDLIFVEYCLFFQAEDGIRDLTVTGVQTCALPIWTDRHRRPGRATPRCEVRCGWLSARDLATRGATRMFLRLRIAALFCAGLVSALSAKIGRASCRERV